MLGEDLNKFWNPVHKKNGVMSKMLDYELEVSEFELQSCYYVRKLINTLGKGIKPSYPPHGLNSTTAVHLPGCLWHHHHHVVPQARISPTLSRHISISFIASGRSSGLHPVSSHSCCMYVRAGRPAFSRPYVGVHRSKSLMSSSLLLQQGPACLVRLTLMVFVMGGSWPYNWYLVGCCRQDLFNIARSILV